MKGLIGQTVHITAKEGHIESIDGKHEADIDPKWGIIAIVEDLISYKRPRSFRPSFYLKIKMCSLTGVWPPDAYWFFQNIIHGDKLALASIAYSGEFLKTEILEVRRG